MNYQELEKLSLTEEEIEFIKHTIINPDLKNPECMKWFSWRNQITRTATSKENNNLEVIKQYERIREIENFFTILKEEYCTSIIELSQKLEIMDDIEKEFHTKVLLEYITIDMEDTFNYLEWTKAFEEDENDINDPFIQDMIKEITSKEAEFERYIRLDRLISSAEFKHVNDLTILSIVSLVLKEYDKASKNNQRLFLMRNGVAKTDLTYLLVKNLKHLPIIIDDTNNNTNNNTNNKKKK